jgi:hypothetical protein
MSPSTLVRLGWSLVLNEASSPPPKVSPLETLLTICSSWGLEFPLERRKDENLRAWCRVTLEDPSPPFR